MKTYIFSLLFYLMPSLLFSNIWISQNGEAWKKQAGKIPFGFHSKLLVFQKQLWAIGKNTIYQSKNGIHWTEISQNRTVNLKKSMLFRGSIWIFDIENKRVLASMDMKSWEIKGRLPSFMNERSCIANYQNESLFVFSKGKQWKSTDGLNWKKVSRYFGSEEVSLCFSYKRFVWIITSFLEDPDNNHMLSSFHVERNKWKHFDDFLTWPIIPLKKNFILLNEKAIISNKNWAGEINFFHSKNLID